LAAAFRLPEEAVEAVVFLGGRADVYEQDEQGIHHLCRAAARAIDGAFARLARQHRDAVCVFNEVAGLPEAKPVVVAAAQYRFGDARPARSPEREAAAPVAAARILVPPAESLQTRRAVRQLLQRGS